MLKHTRTNLVTRILYCHSYKYIDFVTYIAILNKIRG